MNFSKKNHEHHSTIKMMVSKKITFLLTLFCVTFSFSQTVFKLDSLHIFSWDETGNEWNHNTRDLYTYANGGDKETKLLRLVSDDNGMTWNNFYQFDKTYTNDLIAENIQQTWTGAEWQNAMRELYTYNIDDELEVLDSYLFLGVDWQIFDQHTYVYDVMGNEISDELRELNFINFMLENKERWTYSYTGIRKDQDIKESWTVANVWENDDRKDYFYDSNDLFIRLEERTWTNSDVWSDPFQQTLLEYNMDDLPESITQQTFGSGNWNNTARTLNTYTSLNLLESVLQEWNSGATNWDNSSRFVNTYNTDDNLTEQILQEWEGIGMVWENFLRTLHFWSVTETLSVTFLDSKDVIKIYPNPTADVLQIRFQEQINAPLKAIVYDVFGKTIQTKNIPAGLSTFKIPLHQQSNGVYLLEIQHNGSRQIYRVIKN